jgi:nanoRNase/pAp phosphatase (c-di-AMP/oligoRNAs hydrolase)
MQEDPLATEEEVHPIQSLVATGADLGRVLAEHRGERHLIILPDLAGPDAISSAFAHQLICAEFDVETDILQPGNLTRRQDRTLVRVLDLNLVRYEDGLDLQQYAGAVFVAHQGEAAEILRDLEAANVPIVVIVDHHPLDELSAIRSVGATATIYAEYLRTGAVQLDASRREHGLVATALVHGILNETRGFVEAKTADFRAAAFLSRFRDSELLEQLRSQTRSKRTMEVIRQALHDRTIVENYSLAGIGYVRAEDREAIPETAQFLLTEANVHTAVVYGVLLGADDQETLVGSMRTARIIIDPAEFIHDVFGEATLQSPASGDFEIPVGFLSGGGDSYREHKWRLFDAQIKYRILARIGVEHKVL